MSQTDFFGADQTAVRSFPPHLDPARPVDFTVLPEQDRDHVAAAINGVLPVGALGRNALVYVLRVVARDTSETLAVYLHADAKGAWRQAAQLDVARRRNAQLTLF